MIVSFVIAAIVLLFSYISYDKYQKEQRLKWIKIPKGLPIFGHALDFKSSITLLPMFGRFFKETNSDMYVLSILNRYFIVVQDYDFLEFVMSSSKIINKSRDYKFFANWLKTGLLTADGAKWRPRRKIITPAFHFKILETFVEVFEANGTVLMEKFRKEVGKESINIYNYITLYALDIICETAMGVKVKAQEDSDSEYVRSVKHMCRILIDRAFSPLKQFDFFYQFSSDYRLEKKCLKVLHGYTNSVIKQRQEELKNKKDDGEVKTEDSDVGVKQKKAFLDLLLEAEIDGQPLSTEDIREEVDTFMFEGHDTTTSGISFILYCLANHPEAQKKAYAEQKDIFGADLHRASTHSDLMNMKYLDLVIKETLRLYPSVPFVGRHVDEDIEYNGNIIPKGSTFTAYIFGLNRHPKLYDNPDEFNPSRFEEPQGNHKKPYAFLSFSAGPRNCIGQKFAMLEMKSVVSKMLRNFELLPAVPEHKVVLNAETVLKSANGVNIQLQLRKT